MPDSPQAAQLLGARKGLLGRARHDAANLGALVARPVHREGLATARLAVREDAHLEAVERRLRQLRHLGEDVGLAGGLVEDAVKLVAHHPPRCRPLAGGVGRKQLNDRAVGGRRTAHTHRCRRGAALHAAEDANVALEVLDGLVHLAPQLLLGAAALGNLLECIALLPRFLARREERRTQLARLLLRLHACRLEPGGGRLQLGLLLLLLRLEPRILGLLLLDLLPDRVHLIRGASLLAGELAVRSPQLIPLGLQIFHRLGEACVVLHRAFQIVFQVSNLKGCATDR
eukprot:scaffold64730_cov63-Phaeocystis_antarctica.AAC.3